jgi:hypothetical protein
MVEVLMMDIQGAMINDYQQSGPDNGANALSTPTMILIGIFFQLLCSTTIDPNMMYSGKQC